MADNLATLELAHRLREAAYSTSWSHYSNLLLEAAEELEAFVHRGETARPRSATAA